ncbi:MAG: hypothetical protein ACOC10_05005 [Bacteroidota bacterium]
MAIEKAHIVGDVYVENLVDGVSLADDATQALEVTGYKSGIFSIKYKTEAGAIYTANFNFHTTNDTVTLANPDNTTDFDNADTDAKFDLYVANNVVTLKNRTGATVTAYANAVLFK